MKKVSLLTSQRGLAKGGSRRRFLKLMTQGVPAGAVISGLEWAAPLHAQEVFPNRALTFIMSSGAGSGPDLMCRFIAQVLSANIKQPVVVENRVGAAGAIAGQAVVRAKPDGYTLLFGSASGTIINQAMQPKPPFDTLTELAPIAQIGSGGIPLVVSSRFPVSDLRGFIAHIKANPGKYQYGSWGVGSSGHLVMEWIKNANGLEMDHVPYKSVPALTQDLQGGAIDIGMIDSASAWPLYKLGRIKVLGISGTNKPPNMQDVPLMSEQGVAFTTDGWYGIFAPRDTPAAIVTLLNREIARVLAAPETRARLAQLNIGNSPTKSAEQFAATVRADFAVWQQIVRTNNIRID